MFDINNVINGQINAAYIRGRREMMREIMDLLGKHNANQDHTYIGFVQDLLDLSEEEGTR